VTTRDGSTGAGTDATPDATGPHEHLRSDPHLGPYVESHGELDLEPAEDPFARTAVSVMNQQLSTASAAAIRDRVFDRFQVTPSGMLAADEAALRDAGLSPQKVEYLREIARAFEDGRIDPDRYAGMDDEAVVDELTDIRGVGDWTAKMFLMFVLGREDVFPVEDLGIRRGMEALFGDLTRAEMVKRAEPWRPYRSYAALYLWRAVD
jgi:DNA-3-methyladenine glycosylase II